MVVEKIECFVLSHELDRSFFFSQFKYDSRTVCLTRITLDDGRYGWGEGYGPAKVIKAGVEFLAPLIIGKNPLHQENLWQAMYLRSLDHARRGILLSALSALDIALWDLKGKILGQPVSVLLGGRRRESVKAYATGMYFTETDALAGSLAEEAASYRDEGFQAMKMKVGLDVQTDIQNVRAVRERIGPDTELMIDANHSFSVSEALQLAEAVKPFGITWFEEPISPEDYEGYRELRGGSMIPIAAGECEHLRFGFLHLLRNRCVDIAQPDPCAAGGITETKKIADLIHSFGVEFAPHCWGTCVALATSLHLLSNWDPVPGRLQEKEPVIELDRTQNLFREELGTISIELTDGRLAVPTGPGLGIELDHGMIQRYRAE
jgi:D-galactarolactone cycloisomerase